MKDLINAQRTNFGDVEKVNVYVNFFARIHAQI
jgi:hypothetical protein